ncbi:MAG: glycosyltransferase N-terminal domain-containing protein, partial [Syntrophorhabdales bacterium]
MWRLIYNLLVHSALPFFVLFALTRKKIRRNFFERLFPVPVDDRLKDAIWIHAASVGEAVVAENFLSYARTMARNDFIITTNTYYTRDLLRKKFGGSIDVFSLPFDLPFSLTRFIGASTFSA